MSIYDPVAQSWSTWIGALDLTNLDQPRTLHDSARTFGCEIRLEPAPVPTWPAGPAFTSDAEVAALLTTKADDGRLLAELPIA